MVRASLIFWALSILADPLLGAENKPQSPASPLSLAREPSEKQVINENPQNGAELGPQVRIAIKFAHLKPIGTDNKGKMRFTTSDIKRHVLRARMNKINHFYLGQYHVETKPLSWVRQTNQARFRVTIGRVQAKEGRVEELLGRLDVAGKLEPNGENLYLLRGEASKRLIHPTGEPFVDVVAGFRAKDGGNDVATKNQVRPEIAKKGAPSANPTSTR